MKIINETIYLKDGKIISAAQAEAEFGKSNLEEAYKNTLAYGILKSHNILETKKNAPLKIKFDAMASHDITYVGIIQTARASGLKEFPLPYVLTCCHNSLCAVGGTINEDDHLFGLSAAKKYGGIFVPPHLAVIHSYMREKFAGCGKMILGSDSHTRYGALGTMAIGEGGPELVKQLLNKTYDINYPRVVAVKLSGSVSPAVGPHDVAIALIGEVFKSGLVKNAVMEFVGEGISGLPQEFRNGIDVMTTETACLSSVWETDEKTREYLTMHGRASDYKEMKVRGLASYDALIEIDLSEIKPMIAFPFHPSNAYTIEEFKKNSFDILTAVEEKAKSMLPQNVALKLKDKLVDGRFIIEQGVIAGCAGGIYDNIAAAANILEGKSVNGDFTLSVYPASQPVYYEIGRNGILSKLLEAGAVVKTAFCGPCFGAGDVPANDTLSIRHTTRNFVNREGSKPKDNQLSSVALMDARSIAATAVNEGVLTSAEEIRFSTDIPVYHFNNRIYENKVTDRELKPDVSAELRFGPNIADWPEQIALRDNLILKMCSVIHDEVTTTDELIPSGETSSYRSNPLKLSEFTLSRKDPEYVDRAKKVKELELLRRKSKISAELEDIIKAENIDAENSEIGSVIFANKPGDGSAREQAASCQRVLGGLANIAKEYATKRYRSNLINWGIIPFTGDFDNYENGDVIVVKNFKKAFENGETEYNAVIYRNGIKTGETVLKLDSLTEDEKSIILSGCLINYYNM